MDIKQITADFDAAIVKYYDEYCVLHEELNKHRGKTLDDTELLEVNRLLKEIQEKYALIHPALHVIGSRYQFAVNVANEYNDFIETIKKAGAQQQPDVKA